MKTLSRRLATVGQSATVAITGRAKELTARGVDIIALSVGEPDFPTPAPIIEATIAALRRGDTRYTPVGGVPALRAAAAARFSDLYGVPFGADEVAVTVGGKQGLYELFQSLLDPGDEVLVPTPCWVSYPDQVRLAGGTPVGVPCRALRGFDLDVDALADAVTERTVGVVVNSPSNPTGAVYSRGALEALARLAVERDLWVISDDIYSALTYDGVAFTSILHVAPELRDRVFIIHGVSKTYGMTGYRVGLLGAPAPLVATCLVVQGQSTSNATSFAQHGALAALTGDQGFLTDWLAAYDARRRRLQALLDAIDGVRCPLPAGAFYVFADVRGLLGSSHRGEVLADDVTLCRALLERAHVALVPGTAFGAPGFVRASYACALELLEEAATRIAGFAKALA